MTWAKGNMLTKLFHVTCCEAGMIIWVQLLDVVIAEIVGYTVVITAP